MVDEPGDLLVGKGEGSRRARVGGFQRGTPPEILSSFTVVKALVYYDLIYT